MTKTANNTAAQANLQTALTGADTYYTSNNQTYTGLYAGGTGVSGITAIDTGLTYVTNATTNKSNTISLLSGGSGTWLIMAAFAPGTKDCWLIVDLKSSVTTAFTTGLPSTDWAAGTYYAVIRNDTESAQPIPQRTQPLGLAPGSHTADHVAPHSGFRWVAPLLLSACRRHSGTGTSRTYGHTFNGMSPADIHVPAQP